jgi:ABC-type Mn2+/Zn2+ transport system permease subunit
MSGPFQFEFMREALLAGSVIAVLCGVLSCFLVLRGWALMGDAICHAALPGIVGAYWLGLPLSLGAFLSGLFCAIASGYVKATSRVKEDTVMGVVFTGLFALGLVMISRTTSDIHLDHILYGNILGLTPSQILETIGLAVPILLLVLAKRRDLLLLGFDSAHAQTLGLATKVWHYVLLISLAVTTVTAMKAAGLILAVAMLILPGATASLIAKRLDFMLCVSAASALISMWMGLVIAFYADASPGACVVLTQALLLALAWGYGQVRASLATKTAVPHSAVS